MTPSTLQVPGRGREQEAGGKRSHFSALTDLHACSSHFPGIEGTPLLVLSHAGYFHPHVLCHHRPGGSVLHNLPSLVAWRCRGCEGKDGAEGPSILLADAPVEFCFWSLFGSCVGSSKRPLTTSSNPEAQLISSSVSGCG
uniref:RIKEN cDNA B230217C12 gene n=1 Tax=Mus musculus TaxID=10090 RepID=E9Q3Z1_MOUSE|eukprot:NP_001074404.1 uncharacterized protein LOC68127 [Mus musculus]